ncbi:hypothetical protein [Priestia koreensis]|uniref:hypothetical protein n=1 Tax=Priestia koreensis TaxID=284581 RepID=UPI001F5A12FF|nr:hypothetical protein [Priestia koreensis]UNL83376.1 hypothetical protein IE339_14485 [Priestia koreensis]
MKKKKQKQSASSILISLVLGGVLGFVGVLLLMNTNDEWVMSLPLWSILVFLVLSYYVQIFVHELGHLLAGLTQRFHFHSLNVAGFTVDREGETFKFSWNRAQGLGGFCIMLPTEKKASEMNFGIFLSGGIVMNGLAALLGAYLLLSTYITQSAPYLALFILMNTIFGAFSAVTNLLPFRAGGFKSDGANLLSLIRKSPKDKAEIQIVMMTYEVSGGVNPLAMEEDIFTESGYFLDHDVYGMTLNNYRMFRAYVNSDLERAGNYAKRIEENLHGYPSVFRYKMVYQILFYYACIEKNDEMFAKNFREVEKPLKRDSSIEAERVRMLNSYMKGDAEEMNAHFQRMKHLAHSAKIKGDAKMELQVAEQFLSKVA